MLEVPALGGGGELGAEMHADCPGGAVASQRQEHRKPVYAVVQHGVVASWDVGAVFFWKINAFG